MARRPETPRTEQVDSEESPRPNDRSELDRFRDLIVVASVPDAIDSGLIEVPPDRVDVMTGQAGRAGLAQLTRALQELAGF